VEVEVEVAAAAAVAAAVVVAVAMAKVEGEVGEQAEAQARHPCQRRFHAPRTHSRRHPAQPYLCLQALCLAPMSRWLRHPCPFPGPRNRKVRCRPTSERSQKP